MKNALKLMGLVLFGFSIAQALPLNLKLVESTLRQSDDTQSVQESIQTLTAKINFAFGEMVAKSRSINVNNCKPEMAFQFLTPAKNSTDAMEDFEEHAIHGRFVDCLDNATPEKLIELMMSEKFILSTVKGVQEVNIDRQKQVVCMKISMFPFGKTNFCYNYTIQNTADGVLVRNGLNRNLPDSESPVYMQEGLIILKTVAPNKVAVVGTGLGRGPKIPFHGVAIKVFAGEQQKFFKELRKQLNQ